MLSRKKTTYFWSEFICISRRFVAPFTIVKAFSLEISSGTKLEPLNYPPAVTELPPLQGGGPRVDGKTGMPLSSRHVKVRHLGSRRYVSTSSAHLLETPTKN